MEIDDTIPNIQLIPSAETPEAQEAILAVVEPSPGYPPATQLLVESIRRDATVTVLDYTRQQVVIRYRIDGIWHPGSTMDRERGDFMLATLKELAGLDYRQRRARQEGEFKTLYKKEKRSVRIISQGVKTGERVALYFDWKKPPLDTVEQLGMRASMIPQLEEILENRETGLVLVSAVPGEGYTSAWRGVLDACDRLTRDYYVIEEVNEVEPEVINFGSVTFDRSRGETSLTPLTELLLKQPDVLAFPDLPDATTINGIVDLSIKQKMPVFVRSPGKNALDAVLRLIAKKPDVEKLVNRLDAVVAMRTIRKLCDRCKIGFAPHPKLLQKLGIPPGRIAEFYRPFIFKPGMVDENEEPIKRCPRCCGIGYKGRTGIFELLKINDAIRDVLIQTPRMDKLLAVAQQSRHVTMQQEGILLVAQGITSIEELQRVLKS